ncbi:hypothetical protein V8C26DRAFT_391230 [Trichoderma gracile]
MPRFFDVPEDVDSGELFSLTFEDVKSNASSHHTSPSSAHSPAASEASSASRLASLVRSPVSPKFKSARSSTRSSLARQSNGAGEKAEGTALAKAGKEMTPASSSSGARQSTRVRSAPAQAKPAAAKTTRKSSASAKRELRTKGRTDAKGAVRKPGRPARAAATTKTAATKTAAVKSAAPQRRGRPPAKEAKAAKPAKAAAAGAKASKQEWEVEQIVDSMIDEETMEHFFRVKWKGYSSKDNTWEPKKNLANCKDLLEAYEKKAKK